MCFCHKCSSPVGWLYLCCHQEAVWGDLFCSRLFLTSLSDFQGRCFGNRLGVFGSHAVSRHGGVWIMQTCLITPCSNPLDWKSSVWQPHDAHPPAAPPRRGEDTRVPQRFPEVSTSTGSRASADWMRWVYERRRVSIQPGPRPEKKKSGHRQWGGMSGSQVVVWALWLMKRALVFFYPRCFQPLSALPPTVQP